MGRTRIECCYQCPDRHPGCHGQCEKYRKEKAELEEAKAETRRHYDIAQGINGQRCDAYYRVTNRRHYRNKFRKG